MKIEVTAEDIRNGRAMDCDRSVCCPIALACQRAYLGNRHISVSSVAVFWHKTRRSTSFVMDYAKLPFETQNFISNFDAYGKAAVKPFSFELGENQ